MIKAKYILFILFSFLTSVIGSHSFSQKIPFPKYYGFYIVDEGKLVEFKNPQKLDLSLDMGRKGTEINYSGLDVKGPKLYFIFYEKGLGFLSDAIELYKLVHVKLHLKWGLSDSFKSPPKIFRLKKWLITDKNIRLRREPIKKEKDMILLVPESLLEPGVYAIKIGDSYLDFSIKFEKYDPEREALDRITEAGWDGWMRDKYVPCYKSLVIFKEDFNDNNKKWYEKDSSIEFLKVSNSKYVFSFDPEKTKNTWFCSWMPISIDQNFNFTIEATIKKVSGENSGGYGIFWGNKNISHYFMEINGNGQFQYTKDTLSIIKWIESPHINKANDVNKLSVKKVGENILFYINDNFIQKEKFERFNGNTIGFKLRGKLRIEIDNISVSYNFNP